MDTGKQKLSVEPNDDASAARAEIEIIASQDLGNGQIVICTVTTPASMAQPGMSRYIQKCVNIAFLKQGYKVNTSQLILHDEQGRHWVHAVMQKV
jgi:hypothetical protein